MNQPAPQDDLHLLSEAAEREFGLKLRNKLNAGLNGLDTATAQRLQSARQVALARHAVVAESRFSLAGAGRGLLTLGMEYGGGLALSLALLVAVAGTDYWMGLERNTEMAEVDSQLLVDDLPIDAYLDKGFDAWLRMSEPDAS
ncbi:DUF3619 family protein [Uliginosibacterium sp. H1]|uniref:DUF3619 family protein n=1 Tax=Uliginosibacterium sp. H1 TaxID=3114757 RepID=UPI002E196E96|nr:DUF3619 family protein [Uliginosibacterium sp. H1]